MDMTFVTNLLLASVRMATPLIFVSLAELYSQRAGLTNIGLEGTMSLCALIAVTCAWKTGNALMGVVGAMVLGILLSLMIGFFASL